MNVRVDNKSDLPNSVQRLGIRCVVQNEYIVRLLLRGYLGWLATLLMALACSSSNSKNNKLQAAFTRVQCVHIHYIVTK